MSQIKKVYYAIDLAGNSLINAGFEAVTSLPTINLFLGRKVTLTTDGADYTYGTNSWNKTSNFDETSFNIHSTISGYFAGIVSINTTIGKQMFRTPTVFPTGASGSRITVDVAPTSSVALDIIHTPDNAAAVSVGTINFAANSLNGSVTIPADVTVAAFGVIKITTPSDLFGMEGLYFDLSGYSNLPKFNNA